MERGHPNNRPDFKYVTTKWAGSQIDVYEVMWDQFKNTPVTFLEIGVYYGESLRYWREFFGSEAKIVGVDINPLRFREVGDDFIAEVCDQNNIPGLQRIAVQHGPFDLIVDDGRHLASETEKTFRIFWPCLKDKGYYVIEDCHGDDMREYIKNLLIELTTSGGGKGIFLDLFAGFGEKASHSPTTIIRKSGDFTGLIRS